MKNNQVFGMIGLGDMGAPMAANIARSGVPLSVYDRAGSAERAPDGANVSVAADAADVARAADVIFVSVPDAAASLAVAEAVAATAQRRASALVNLSTVGVAATAPIVAALADSVAYIDAPVSGGRSGAVAGTLTVMWSGSETLFNALTPTLESFTKSRFYVGATPGQGQALKLLNNYLSAVAMAATSEAALFGLHHGLELKTLLDVVGVSTGQNTAVSDKFPKRVLTETFDAGFRMPLMAKDVALYLQEARTASTPIRVAEPVEGYWQEGLAQFPDGDFTEIFKLIRDRGKPQE